jgi:hypothetical protein
MLPITIDPKPNEIIPIKKLQEIAKEYVMKEVQVPEEPGISYGVEETKDVIAAGVALANAVISSLKDGKVTLTDIPAFIAPVTKLPAAISGIALVPAELADLDAIELQELTEAVKAQLEVDDEKAKVIIQKSIQTLYGLYDLVKAIKN